MRALQLLDDRKLELTDIPEPEAPGPGEVTLRVKAVALNHIDVWGWRGMAFAKRKMPLVIGAEAAGVVDQIGPGVANVLPGQLVGRRHTARLGAPTDRSRRRHSRQFAPLNVRPAAASPRSCQSSQSTAIWATSPPSRV